MHSLVHEWLSLPHLSQRERDELTKIGVTYEATLRSGGLMKARMEIVGRLWRQVAEGSPVLVTPCYCGPIPSPSNCVEAPCLIDLIAWQPNRPEVWWYRTGRGVILNKCAYDEAHYSGEPITLHTTPLQWLQANCRGACHLPYNEAYDLIESAAA